jgi:hypothetical protein
VYLTTWSVTNPDNITAAGSYTLNVSEALTAARFDGTHGYLVASRNIDPLFTFDLTDPAHPALLGQLSMTGWLDYLQPMGGQIAALGHDETTDANGNTIENLAVSLIDTTSQPGPTLMSRVPVGAGWGWVPSSPDDYAKVFKVLPDVGLIMLPFQSWDSTNYSYVGGVQLVDLNPTSLRLRGLIQNAGWVERGITDGPNTVLTLSDQYFQIMDITDRDNPAPLGRLELSRDVQDFQPLNDNWAAQLSGDWALGNTSLVLTPLMQPDTVTPASEVHIPAPYGRLFVNGNLAYLTSMYDATGGNNPTTHVQVYDLSDPSAPVTRGSVTLPAAVYPGYHYWYWGYGDEVTQINGTVLAFHQFEWDYWDVCDDCPGVGGPSSSPPDTIYLVDLSNPDAPAVASTLPIRDASWVWGLSSQGSLLYYSTYRESYRDGQYYARYYLRRIDVTDPAHPQPLAEVNLPGQFIALSGNQAYTLEQYWDQTSSNWNTYFHSLQLGDGVAYLQGTQELPGYVDNVIVNGNTAFVSTWWDQEVASGGTTTWVSQDQLLTVDLTNPRYLNITSQSTLPVDYAWLQKVDSGRAFFGVDWGILTYDVTHPSHPVYQAFYRTEGWSDELIVRGTNLFVPSDDYGVQIIDLTEPGN